MATAPNASSPAQVKPTGECIPFNFKASPVFIDQIWSYDFEIDENFVVTDLDVTKTSADVSLDVSAILTVGIYRIGPGPIATSTETEIAQVAFTSTDLVGTKYISGVKVNTVVIGTDPTLFETNQFAGGAGIAPFDLPVKAEEAAVLGSTKQRIRIKIQATVGGTSSPEVALDPRVFILVKLAKISNIGMNSAAGDREVIDIQA